MDPTAQFVGVWAFVYPEGKPLHTTVRSGHEGVGSKGEVPRED